MRKVPFVKNEYYHIYNRGVDKRDIFCDEYDMVRFFQSMDEFNTVEPIGSIFENQFKKQPHQLGRPTSKLVDIVCYCLNPNHYHFIITPLVDGGVSEFMKRLGGGYAKYFNEKYNRSGALFQGKFKSVHLKTNTHLLHASTYVNLNNKVHKLGRRTSKSSWDEYTKPNVEQFCDKDIILGQFKTRQEYKKFAEDSLEGILIRRKNDKDTTKMLLE